MGPKWVKDVDHPILMKPETFLVLPMPSLKGYKRYYLLYRRKDMEMGAKRRKLGIKIFFYI
jgi:hypothetical protein